MAPQREFVPKTYTDQDEESADNTLIHLKTSVTDVTTDFTFEAIKPGLFRTTFSSKTHPLPPFPSAPRLKPDGLTSIVLDGPNDFSKILACGDIEATVDWTGAPIVSVGFTGHQPLHTDLPFRSYVIDGPGIAHYTRYHRNSLYVGLGEKAAPMDLSNRHFTLSATDCFGYDVHRTDPMYKHIPLLIRATPNGVVATFSTSHARGCYSVGSEMDGMWGPFKVYRQDYGGLELYTMIGRTLQEVVKLYADLVGYPLLVPRWAFGYLAGGMKYSMLDSPRASDALMQFAVKLEKHDIPCSGFQMSSGYTVAEKEPKTGNVFSWNRHRFPDPKGFCDAFHRRGIRLIANVKPYVLASHPEYEKLREGGTIFSDPRSGKSAVARLWSAGGGESGEGGYIDFSSKAGWEFWYNGVKELRKTGMGCMWNDNNEYTIPDDAWMLELSHTTIQDALNRLDEERKDIGLWGRAMQCELMAKCSHDALAEAKPDERPFVLTRSATAGTMRYAASSWSGDNVTSWDSMRGANALSVTAGMCLLQCYGHDIGGFEGPQPSPELLLRWVQLGIHSPRFAINCFKTLLDNNVGDVIEPWMYPQIIPEIRKAIRRRYEIIPYLYSLMLQSHRTAVPPQRWTGWGYEADHEVWTNKVLKDGETQYWLGDTLLIGGIYEPGQSQAHLYLPKRSNDDAGFLNTNTPYQYLSAGQWATIHSPWKESIPVLARIGGAVPVGKNKQVAAPGEKSNKANLTPDNWRGVEVFPPPEESSDGTKTFVASWLEDDGISLPPAKVAKFVIGYAATSHEVAVSIAKDTTAFTPPWVMRGLTIILPVGDKRQVVSSDERVLIEARREDESGRRRFLVHPEGQVARGKHRSGATK
ncbi:hypothetical protein LTR37_009539 [Vermiconidia calcicola]|uniref:Uncharacterized protein n=1 Tax=Vermiconidia calcicola TaxID=1690605 RepID=A0ACC3N7G3_9PEZI|nr:hypothetical protein LTR37_009539 [Vermiconidia calcicola]